jgi:hypothetical protein
MHHTKLTIAVATAGTGMICLAPAASADTTNNVPPDPVRGNTITPGAEHLGVAPCVRVLAPGAPSKTIIPNLGVNPCVRPGVVPIIRINTSTCTFECP